MHLRRLLKYPPVPYIQYIFSFCLRIVKRLFVRLSKYVCLLYVYVNHLFLHACIFILFAGLQFIPSPLVPLFFFF